jgi:large exoprotein involved in heme utilization and adhesion
VVDIDVRNEPQAIPLPERVVTAEIDQVCQTNRGQKQNEFIITGRGGLPDNPSGTLNSDAVWTDWREPRLESRIQSEESVTNQSQMSQPPIVEANGWVINDKGQVVLIATAPTVAPHSSGMPPTTCRDF